mmetsp:Transcript_73097/g.128793  ORF Transcript_73097/g.128793 Transcript_73097/m.128793 type:complete len:413 (-) Transcript_73097:884-2122(-)
MAGKGRRGQALGGLLESVHVEGHFAERRPGLQIRPRGSGEDAFHFQLDVPGRQVAPGLGFPVLLRQVRAHEVPSPQQAEEHLHVAADLPEGEQRLVEGLRLHLLPAAGMGALQHLLVVLDGALVHLHFERQQGPVLRWDFCPGDGVHEVPVLAHCAVQLLLQALDLGVDRLIPALGRLQHAADVDDVHRLLPGLVPGAVLPPEHRQVLLPDTDGDLLLALVGGDELLPDLHLGVRHLAEPRAQVLRLGALEVDLRRGLVRRGVPLQLLAQGLDLLLQGADDALVLGHVQVDGGDVRTGDDLDGLGAVGVPQRVVRVLVAHGAGAHGSQHDGPAVPAQRVLQHAGQLAVPVRHVAGLLLRRQSIDAVAQGQEGAVDVDALPHAHPHGPHGRRPLGPREVDQRQPGRLDLCGGP